MQLRTPGLYTATDPITCRPTSRPLRQTNEYIHASARTRYRLDGPGVSDKGLYECRALTDNYRLVVDYGPNDASRSTDPDIHWRLKFRDPSAVKILPEAPLWGIEKELARRDPETYDYIKRPPATGTSSKKKKSRPVSMGGADFAKFGEGKRRSFVEGEGGARGTRGSSGFVERRASERSRERSRGPPTARTRSRVGSFDERETVIRESMPHRGDKNRAWWEGGRPRSPGGQGGGRSPRRSSMRV